MVGDDRGYYDDGEEFYDNSDDEKVLSKEEKKKLVDAKKKKKFAAGSANITSMFLQSKKKKKTKSKFFLKIFIFKIFTLFSAEVKINDDDELNDILREVDDPSNSISITPAKSKKVKKKKKMSLSMKNSELPSIQSRSEKRTSIGMPNPNPKKARLDPKVPKEEPKSQDADMEPPENDFDDFDNFPENDDFDEDLPEMAPETKPNTQSQDNVENEISKQDEKLSKMKVKDEPEPVSMETEVKREVNWTQLTQNDNTNEVEEEFDFGDDENNLVFYWLDAYENQFQRDGKIYLFGRTKEGASCCVTIQNIPHIVYFLPKDGKDFQDVYEEVDEIFEAKERFSKLYLVLFTVKNLRIKIFFSK